MRMLLTLKNCASGAYFSLLFIKNINLLLNMKTYRQERSLGWKNIIKTGMDNFRLR